MVEYLAERIRTRALNYDDVIQRRPDLKEAIDAILFPEPEEPEDETELEEEQEPQTESEAETEPVEEQGPEEVSEE